MTIEQWLPADEAVEIIQHRFGASIGRAQAILKRARTSGEVRSEPMLIIDDDGLVGMGMLPGRFDRVGSISKPAGVDKDDLLHWLEREGAAQKPVQAAANPKRRRGQALRDRAGEAVAALWPTGVPDQAKLPNGALCTAVTKWLKDDCKKQNISFSALTDDTIKRAAGRKK